MKSLNHQLSEYIRACFTGIWITSHEQHEAIHEIAELCRDEQWQLASWNIETGLSIGGESTNESGADPLAAIRSLKSLSAPEETTVLVLQNFHRFMQSPEIVQALAQQIIGGKQDRTIVVVLAPIVEVPPELMKLFVVLDHKMPDREQLETILREIATEDGELPDERGMGAVLDASAGLTRMEAENAYSLSLVREEKVTADTVWEIKTQTLEKSGLLSLSRETEDFATLGGLTALKAFCKRALLQPSRDNPKKRPRGVMLLSPPGCGKSQFCKLLGSEVSRPVLTLDVGSLMGSLVGQSEERTRQALAVVDAMAPCVLMIDEVEKAFAGLNGNGDSGVSSRMFGTFLSWLNDHESDVFVVCTANDVSKLPPEFGRSERFDGVFFLDLPDREEKDAIWQIYRGAFEIDAQQKAPKDDSWTGAEIKACCRLAALLDLPLKQAAQNVVPVAVTAAEAVERLRNWASGRCLSANQPGIYSSTKRKSRTRRSVSRDPSNN